MPLSLMRQVKDLLADPTGIHDTGSAAADTVRSVMQQLGDTEAARSPLWTTRSLQRRVEVLRAQFVGHGMVNVNGRRVDIPSYRVRKGDVISLRDKSRQMIVIRHNLDTLDRLKPAWLEVGDDGFQVTVRDLPTREQIDVPVREQLIVELYSK